MGPRDAAKTDRAVVEYAAMAKSGNAEREVLGYAGYAARRAHHELDGMQTMAVKTNAMNCTNERCGHIGRDGKSAIAEYNGTRVCALCSLGSRNVSPWHPPILRQADAYKLYEHYMFVRESYSWFPTFSGWLKQTGVTVVDTRDRASAKRREQL